jgi:hypothetical protein
MVFSFSIVAMVKAARNQGLKKEVGRLDEGCGIDIGTVVFT